MAAWIGAGMREMGDMCVWIHELYRFERWDLGDEEQGGVNFIFPILYMSINAA